MFSFENNISIFKSFFSRTDAFMQPKVPHCNGKEGLLVIQVEFVLTKRCLELGPGCLKIQLYTHIARTFSTR